MKFLLKKKSMEPAWITGIILFVAVLLIFLMILYKYSFSVNAKTSQQICKDSVYLESLTHFKGLTISDVNIKCPMQEIAVDGGSKQEIMEGISSSMADCYDLFYTGQKELFKSGKESILTQVLGEEQKFCVICSKVTFGSEMKISAEELLSYQLDAPIPKDSFKPYEERRSYAEYLQDYRTNPTTIRDDIKEKLKQDIMFDTTHPYAIVFMTTKQEYLAKWMTSTLSAGAGGAVGLGASYLLGVGLVSNPAGWIVAGGMATGGYIGYKMASDTSADWSSGVIAIPFDSGSLQHLGCTYTPADQSSYLDIKTQVIG